MNSGMVHFTLGHRFCGKHKGPFNSSSHPGIWHCFGPQTGIFSNPRCVFAGDRESEEKLPDNTFFLHYGGVAPIRNRFPGSAPFRLEKHCNAVCVQLTCPPRSKTKRRKTSIVHMPPDAQGAAGSSEEFSSGSSWPNTPSRISSCRF